VLSRVEVETQKGHQHQDGICDQQDNSDASTMPEKKTSTEESSTPDISIPCIRPA